MPEGSTAGPPAQPAANEPPPSPEDQIKQQINLGAVAGWLGDLFGADWGKQAGGGGTGGQYMFADLNELNGVITQWETELEAIKKDGQAIRQAAALVEAPAQDGMTIAQAEVTRTSLTTLREHNDAMRDYAQGYLDKLRASRDSIANNEANNVGTIKSADRG
jgi:hypothetical protein